MYALRWTCHAATTIVEDDDTVITKKRVIAECDTEEHARLFAAAPAMLALLTRIDQTSTIPLDELPDTLAEVKRTIAQARGEA